MQNTNMDRITKTRSEISQLRNEAAASYSRLFMDMTRDWNLQDISDRAWLMYSANYLFRTAGVRWAMDPLLLHRRVPETPAVNLNQAFQKLDFVVLTHNHVDHLDYDMLQTLQHLPIQWVIPEFMLPQLMVKIALSKTQITVPRPLEPFEIRGIRFFPMEGHHFEKSPVGERLPRGVPSMAYIAEFNGKRWFFPGDTRNYQALFSPSPGHLDGMFAHLWLGRGCALMDDPPLLEEFCRFCSNLKPSRIILTHLDEFGRDEDDTWGLRHVQMVLTHLAQAEPQTQILAARMGECVIL